MLEEIGKDSAPVVRRRRTAWLPYALGGLIAILLAIAVFLVYRIFALPGITIPAYIVRDAHHSIFVPKELPGGYKITEGSFAVSEEALVFQAEDSDGSSIAFTEQKRPENLDFETFYKEQMENAKKLKDTPYPSVIGRLPNGDKTMLSIVTDDTWILVSTAAPLGEQDCIAIAKSLKKY